jgi:photosystem II stability/assembly factor-like uncharacterized protein
MFENVRRRLKPRRSSQLNNILILRYATTTTNAKCAWSSSPTATLGTDNGGIIRLRRAMNENMRTHPNNAARNEAALASPLRFRMRVITSVVLAIGFLAFCVEMRGTTPLIQDSIAYQISPAEVTDIFFLNSSSIGWMAVADHSRNKSFLLKTVDGGRTWSHRKAPKGIIRLFFLNSARGWALGSTEDGSTAQPIFSVLRTSDGGDSWTSSGPIRAGDNIAVIDIGFFNETHGWLVGIGPPFGSALVLETTDGGKSFQEIRDLPESVGGTDWISVGEKMGVWIYGPGTVLHSFDEGKTWQTPIDLKKLGTSKAALDITSAYFSGSGRGWLAGQDPEAMILGTEDFGRGWRLPFKSQEAGDFWGISFWDDQHGCSSSVYPELLFCTTDGGLTWQSRNVLPQATGEQAKFFKKLIMLKSGRGWALRGGGFLYETTDEGRSWKEMNLVKHLR